MAKVHKSVIKRARQNEVRREHNNAIRSSLRTSIRKVVRALDSGDLETAKTELGLAHNESRSWHGWNRHVSLVMLAFAMMTGVRHHANQMPPPKMKSRARRAAL